MFRWRVAILLGGVFLASCGRAPPVTAEFWSNVGYPGVPPYPGTMAGAVRIAVDSSRATTLVSVEPVTDAGVEAEYRGYTTCARGCPGAGPLDADAEQVIAHGQEGRLPLHFKAGRDERWSLIFALWLTDDGRKALPAAGCLGMRAVRLRFSNGQRVQASSPVRYVAVFDDASQYSECIKL